MRTEVLSAPAKEKLSVLVLIDEVLMYARQMVAMESAWHDRLVDFFQYLTQAAAKVDRVVIPQRAVQQDQQGHYVRIIDAENTVQRKNIQVGVRDDTDWSVLLGLEAGDRVITEGGASFKPGTVGDIVDQPQ